jgi:5'-methylthioadenosine phosphorylase
MIDLAIISGTGFYDFPVLKEQEGLTVETRYGNASLRIGAAEEKKVAFIARHGKGHSILPNMINYRANLVALKELRTKAIVATTVCGVLDPDIPLAKLAVFDDMYFPDNRLPNGEACTVYDKRGEKSRGHYIFDKPFSQQLRQQLIDAAADALTNVVYAHANGPRFNTKAEIKMLRSHASFVSQTAGPEIVLAGELEIPYALLGFGVDYANGVKKEPTPVEELKENLKKSKMVFTSVIRELIKKYTAPTFSGYIYRFE